MDLKLNFYVGKDRELLDCNLKWFLVFMRFYFRVYKILKRLYGKDLGLIYVVFENVLVRFIEKEIRFF